jgi:hypothetical protein
MNRIDMMRACRGTRRTPWWYWFLEPMGILTLCIILILLICYVPAIVTGTEGSVTISTASLASAQGYMSEKTWNMTFVEKGGTYSVVHGGSHFAPGDRFELLKRLDGGYTLGDAK